MASTIFKRLFLTIVIISRRSRTRDADLLPHEPAVALWSSEFRFPRLDVKVIQMFLTEHVPPSNGRRHFSSTFMVAVQNGTVGNNEKSENIYFVLVFMRLALNPLPRTGHGVVRVGLLSVNAFGGEQCPGAVRRPWHNKSVAQQDFQAIVAPGMTRSGRKLVTYTFPSLARIHAVLARTHAVGESGKTPRC